MKKVFCMLAVIGFFVVWGAVGTCDYMVETYQYYPLRYTVYQLLIGIALMLPAYILHIKENY